MFEGRLGHHSGPSSSVPSGHGVSVRYERGVAQQRVRPGRVSFVPGGVFTSLPALREQDELLRRYAVGSKVPVQFKAGTPESVVPEPGVRSVRTVPHIAFDAFLVMSGVQVLIRKRATHRVAPG